MKLDRMDPERIRFTEPDDQDPPAQFMWMSLVVGVGCVAVVVVMAVAQ